MVVVNRPGPNAGRSFPGRRLSPAQAYAAIEATYATGSRSPARLAPDVVDGVLVDLTGSTPPATVDPHRWSATSWHARRRFAARTASRQEHTR